MKAPNLATARRQLDHRIDGPSMTAILEPPRDGWIRTIRQVLGMRLIDLAARLNVTEGAVRRVERAEVRPVYPYCSSPLETRLFEALRGDRAADRCLVVRERRRCAGVPVAPVAPILDVATAVPSP